MQLLDHVSIAVPDLTQARTFYDATMSAIGCEKVYDRADALGYGVRCTAAEPMHTYLAVYLSPSANTTSAIGVSRPSPPGRFALSTPLPSRMAARAMESRACGRITTPLTMAHLSGIPTAIAWRLFAIHPNSQRRRPRSLTDRYQWLQ